MELYKKYRPKKIEDLIGNKTLKQVLNGFLQKKSLPRAILLSGPSGCGKTTIARILAKELKVSEVDYHESNCAMVRGIDFARQIQSTAPRMPMGAGCKLYCLDEAHQLTKDAQAGLLKVLEDPPIQSRAYFVLCTTHPNGLIPTIRSRTTSLEVTAVPSFDGGIYLRKIASLEKSTLSKAHAEAIIEACEGRMRASMVMLEKVLQVEDSERTGIIQRGDCETVAIDLARILCGYKKASWGDVRLILKDMQDEPETVRRIILGYANTLLLSGNRKLESKAAAVIDVMRDNFFDGGKAALSQACYSLFQ